MSLRLPEDEEKYQQAKSEGKLVSLLDIPRKRDFQYWFIGNNKYPHTKIAVRGDMLINKRECAFKDLTSDELFELFYIIKVLNDEDVYNTFYLNAPYMQSVKNIVHIHLVVLKDEMK